MHKDGSSSLGLTYEIEVVLTLYEHNVDEDEHKAILRLI